MFEKLLNQLNITAIEYTTVAQLLEKPSEEEVKIGLDMIKDGKASGEDEIVAECLKKGGQGLLNKLHQLMNAI